MNLTNSGAISSNYQKVFGDETLTVIRNKKDETFLVYNHAVMPGGALLLSDGTHKRFGKRFISQQSAQKEFNYLKTSTHTVNVKQSELL